MSDFVGTAINTADLAEKLTGIAKDFLSGIGCEMFCEVLDVGKDVLFEAIRRGKINHQTKKALENLDQRTVDDLKGFVGKELKKYSKKGKLPKKLKGKDLVDIFMNHLATISKLVDDYAAQNNLSEDRKIALKYILDEIRQCAAQASMNMLEAEDKRLILVVSQVVHNELERYLRSNAGNYFKPLFLYPTHCHYCESPHLSFDDERKVATCKNCGAKTEYRQSLPTDMQQNPYASFDDELKNLNKTIDQVLSIVTNIDAKIDEFIKYGELKQRLIVAQDHIDNYEFSEAVTTCKRIIEEYPDSVDALWCYLQAHYGIVYLKGYNDKVAKPTLCYALDPRSREQLCKHKHYLQIMTLLANDPERKAIYKARQKEIDAAIEKLKEDLRKRVDIDVFICVKIGLATKNNPNADPNLTTEDYENYAKVIYYELKDLGLTPYCSKIDSPQGIDSDAQIWSSMMRSKKILIIGTCKEYLESVWVQCEWRRWLCMIEKLGCRKEETFISWIPVDDWVDQQPDEWSPYRPQICHTKEQVVEKILGKSAPTPLPPPIDNSRAIRDIRALLDQGKIDKAKKLLQPLLDAYPSSGELMLLELRVRTNNFKKLKKSTQYKVDTACKYLNGDPEENPEYKMYLEQKQKVLSQKTKKRKERNSEKSFEFPWGIIGWIGAILAGLALVIGLLFWAYTIIKPDQIWQWINELGFGTNSDQTWQLIIGIMLGMIMAGISIYLCIAKDIWKPQLWIIGAVSLLNLLLGWGIPEVYSYYIAIPIAVGAAVSLAVIAYCAHKNDAEYDGITAAMMLAYNITVAFAICGGINFLGIVSIVVIGVLVPLSINAVILGFLDDEINGGVLSAIIVALVICANIILPVAFPHVSHAMHELPEITNAYEKDVKKAECSCGDEIVVNDYVAKALHIHSCELITWFDDWYSTSTAFNVEYDQTAHWLTCKCGAVLGYDEHAYRNGKCVGCGYVPNTTVGENRHTAIFSSDP